MSVWCDPCGEWIYECRCDLKNKITSLEKEAELKNKQIDSYRANMDRAHFNLSIAIEALEFINTYKSPDYFNKERGSVFDVSRNALSRIRSQSENEKR